MSKSQVPEQFRDYPCEDYFASGFERQGFYSPTEQYALVEKVESLEERKYEEDGVSAEFLSIGGPGVDGILWGYRKNMPGIWAWFPIDGKFRYLAKTVEALLRGWYAGEIRV
jgi:hypothetical protein